MVSLTQDQGLPMRDTPWWAGGEPKRCPKMEEGGSRLSTRWQETVMGAFGEIVEDRAWAFIHPGGRGVDLATM